MKFEDEHGRRIDKEEYNFGAGPQRGQKGWKTLEGVK